MKHELGFSGATLRGVLVVCALLLAQGVHAQATRTWVSGVGDDANPCSRTAPCKTFAGAISKTAAGGEINVLDPGGFGAVTITKSITIDGTSALGGILASGTNGIIINAASTDVVTLKNLHINGGVTGLNGVRILQAGTVTVQDCDIWNFRTAPPNGRGISDERTSGRLHVLDTTMRDNARYGIVVSGAQATLERVHISRSFEGGLWARLSSNVAVRDSVSTANLVGYIADGAGTSVSLVRSTATLNTTGIRAVNNGLLLLSGMTVFGNGLGVDATGGSILSYADNQLDGNATDGALSGNLPLR